MGNNKTHGNTEKSFSDKWHQNPSLIFDETLKETSEIHRWILERNGFKNDKEFSAFLSGKKRILDAGCGNGRVTALMRKLSNEAKTQVIGIDLVAADIAAKNLAAYPNVAFLKKDLLDDLSDMGKFDFIYCQEVLHHTNNPFKAFKNLCALLQPDGEIAIYVYIKKALVREYVDDFIRSKIAGLPYEEAMRHCEQITHLGKTLSDKNVTIEVPEVELLEIKKGEYTLQRFIYHFFMKCFWNDEFSFKDNSVINYDWYHPQLCSRHTLDEVIAWFDLEGLEVSYKFADFYGVTVRGIKRK